MQQGRSSKEQPVTEREGREGREVSGGRRKRKEMEQHDPDPDGLGQFYLVQMGGLYLY